MTIIRRLAYIDYATVYNLQRNYQQAYKYALMAKRYQDKLGSLANRTNAAMQLSEALGGLGRFEEAYKAQRTI